MTNQEVFERYISLCQSNLENNSRVLSLHPVPWRNNMLMINWIRGIIAGVLLSGVPVACVKEHRPESPTEQPQGEEPAQRHLRGLRRCQDPSAGGGRYSGGGVAGHDL